MLKTSKIIFYDEPSVPEINLDDLVKFAKENLGVDCEKRGPIMKLADSATLKGIAASRISKLSVPFQRHEPTIEEIEFEEKNKEDISHNKHITYYDGVELQNAFAKAIPHSENTVEFFHVIFTNKLTCTYDPADYRYHGRALIGSNPSIISTTGIIEAPAKPREYYMELITKSRLGVNTDTLKKKYAGTFLEYHDSRLGKIVEGYFLQAFLYYESGEAFCADKDCRLFNAHWQRDLLHSQLENGKMCDKHEKMILEKVKNLN